MHGNVWEWCADFRSENYYRVSPTDDPPDAADGGETPRRINRGGSFHDSARTVRSARREHANPESSFYDGGFRVPAAITPESDALSFDGRDDMVQTPVKLDVRKPFTVEAVLTLPAAPDGSTFVVSDLQIGGLGFGPTPDGRLQAALYEGKNGKADVDG